MTGYELTAYELATFAISAGQIAVGAVGVFLVWQGLRQMAKASDLREKRDDQRHAEAMRVLDSQAEAMNSQSEALRAVVQGLERQGAALEAALKGGRA